MNLEKFKQTYAKVISESAEESELRNYVRSIVEEILTEEEMNEMNTDRLKKWAGFSGPKKQKVEPKSTQSYQDHAEKKLQEIGNLIDRFPEEISHWAANLDSTDSQTYIYKQMINKLEQAAQQLKQDIGQ